MGKQSFEKEVKRYIDLYPGMVVREGEEFDFQAYYVKRALETNSDLTKFDQKKVEMVKQLHLNFYQELRNLVEPQVEMIDPI